MIALDPQTRSVLSGVVTATGPGWCMVRSRSGRTVKAESVTRWRVGEVVVVIDGVVVGRAGTKRPTQTYEV